MFGATKHFYFFHSTATICNRSLKLGRTIQVRELPLVDLNFPCAPLTMQST